MVEFDFDPVFWFLDRSKIVIASGMPTIKFGFKGVITVGVEIDTLVTLLKAANNGE